MELLLNELSLKGQFSSVHDFIDTAIPAIVSVLNEVDGSSDLLYKKYDFYSAMITSQTDLHAIVKGSISRQFDEIRKFKNQLVKLLEEPYWERNPRHSSEDSYIYANTSISGNSLAEACERDKVVISFICHEFNSRKLNIVKKEGLILVENLFNAGHYVELARERGLISEFSLLDSNRFSRTNYVRQGQTVFKEVQTGYFWYLDNLHRNHFEVFDANEVHLGEADLKGAIDFSKRQNGRTL